MNTFYVLIYSYYDSDNNYINELLSDMVFSNIDSAEKELEYIIQNNPSTLNWSKVETSMLDYDYEEDVIWCEYYNRNGRLYVKHNQYYYIKHMNMVE